jgi:sulfite exporter TauE/SafE
MEFLSSLERGAGYGILLLFGLLASIHCVGMCGGLILTQTLRADDGRKIKNLLFGASLYNAGRVFSYTLTGVLTGGAGQVLNFSGAFKGIIPMAGGAFMLLMAVNLLGDFSMLRKLLLPMPKNLAKCLYKGAGERGKSYGRESRSLWVGLLTGLMPCGPLQIAQVYAFSSRSAFIGALSMFVFAIGTTPALFLFGVFGGMLGTRFSRGMTKVSAVVVGLMGLLMLERGLALSGVALPVSAKNSGGFAAAIMDNNIQRLRTEISAYAYPSIQVTAGIPVEWTIVLAEENCNTCNNAIELPAYNQSVKLSVGENLVKFTPLEEGEFLYTCWMGMIKSKIFVLPDP